MGENKKNLFYLLIIGIIGFILLCATGCGDNSCETLQYGNYEDDDVKFCGASVPGCGGCLTSGKGCGSCLWPQSCKLLYGNSEVENDDSNQTLVAVDTHYYSSGCLGCGQTEESCYSGCLIQDSQNWGLVYGSTESDDEHIFGCSDGCGGCFKSDGEGKIIIDTIEPVTSID